MRLVLRCSLLTPGKLMFSRALSPPLSFLLSGGLSVPLYVTAPLSFFLSTQSTSPLPQNRHRHLKKHGHLSISYRCLSKL